MPLATAMGEGRSSSAQASGVGLLESNDRAALRKDSSPPLCRFSRDATELDEAADPQEVDECTEAETPVSSPNLERLAAEYEEKMPNLGDARGSSLSVDLLDSKVVRKVLAVCPSRPNVVASVLPEW